MDHWNMACFLALGFLPGIVLNLVVWLICRRKAPLPLYIADIVSLVLPIVVWMGMVRYGWTRRAVCDGTWEGLVLLGWIWGVLLLGRMLIPQYTHKLRFRLAAIHVGTLSVIAAALLAWFFTGFGF